MSHDGATSGSGKDADLPLPEDTLFDPWALLAFPPGVRSRLASLGGYLFDLALEAHGIEGAKPQIEAIAASLELAASRLHALGSEAEATELDRRERQMCEHAGRLGQTVGEMARSLRALVGTELRQS